MAKSRNKKGIQIQAGSDQIPGTAAGDVNKNITFPTAFNTTPTVICGWNERNDSQYLNGSIMASAITTSGFTANAVVTTAHAGWTWNFWWVAIIC